MRPAARPRRALAASAGACVASVLLLGLPPAGAEAQEWQEFRAARQLDAFERLEVEIVYGAGRLTVEPAEEGYLYDARLRYDGSRFAPVRSWSTEDGLGRLRLGLVGQGSDGRPSVRLGRDDLSLEGLRELGDASGELELRLSPTLPTELRLQVGAAESRLELGGMALTRLTLETGASETRLSFERPNPIEMEELSITAGAASLRAEGLGNARFRHFRFKGGVGDVTLDFGGAWPSAGAVRAEVAMGVGSLRLRVPERLGLRVRKSSFLTAFTARGLEKVEDGVWESANWSAADRRLELTLDAAFGAVTIERTR